MWLPAFDGVPSMAAAVALLGTTAMVRREMSPTAEAQYGPNECGAIPTTRGTSCSLLTDDRLIVRFGEMGRPHVVLRHGCQHACPPYQTL